MRRMSPSILPIMLTLVSGPAAADVDWKAFGEARRGRCVGQAGALSKPLAVKAGSHSYEIRGSTLVQLDKDEDQILRIGIISAIKDDRDATQTAVRELIEWLQREKMDVLVANGDLASNEFEMETVFKLLAGSGVLVVASAGNTESCGSFNNIAEKTFAAHENFVNGNWVRRLELDDGTLLTLPGYYDKRFAHTGGAAKYKEADVETLSEIAEGAPGIKILVSHGPPKMTGRHGIDIITDGTHVGDQAMAELIDDLGIRFGLFGHILESGGRGTDAAGKKRQTQGKWAKSLFVNAGTANPDPWPMLDGSTGYGMGMFVEVKGKRARYWVKRLDKQW